MSRITKINEAKSALEIELAKENPNIILVNELKKVIANLGIGLTYLDFK